jgi:hypothetical protein
MSSKSDSSPYGHLSPEEETPHFCYDGWVFIGHVVEVPDGSGEVVHEPVPCKRCRPAERG